MRATKARAMRQAALRRPVKRHKRSGWRSWKTVAAVVGVGAVFALSFVVPRSFDKKTSSTSSVAPGEGLAVDSSVPSFSERDLMTGKVISSASVYDHKTLLFFSEGIMCQACFEQIQGLERVGSELQRRGIQLISITPDSPAYLKQAVGQYGIKTPVISDEDGNMSTAFNTLGKGMHSTTPGHAFVLIDKGKVRWYRDYWLPPDRTMYVEPQKLLSDIPSS